MSPAGVGQKVLWGTTQAYATSLLCPEPSALRTILPRGARRAPPSAWACPGPGARLTWRLRGSFHSFFQEGEEILTSFGEPGPHLEKILGATFV